MTTKVNVDAHAGWPVKVVTNTPNGTDEKETVVPANGSQDFYIHDGMIITGIEEMAKGSN